MAFSLQVREKVKTFLNAARDGDLELFKNVGQILDEEKKGLAETVVSVKDANGRGAFHFAAREGQVEICKFIVDKLGVDADIKDDWGETPLFHAARQGQIMTSRYLLENGADPSIVSSQSGATPLHHAARTGNVELLTLLLDRGLDVDLESDAGPPLMYAAGECQPDAVKILLDRDANPNAEVDGASTPLLAAVMAGSVLCVELLIQGGARVNLGDGWAVPLHVAADCGNLDIVNCLLKFGADPNALDEDGWKPIQTAAARGCRDVVEVLFPLTSPVKDISDWRIDGILEQMQREPHKEVETGVSENGKPECSNFRSPEHVEVSEESKSRSLEAKSRGDEAFWRKDFLTAVDAYTQATDFNPRDATILSNRSLCWIRLGQAEQALSDAKACRALRPDWSKACYREGAALRLLLRFDEAADAFYQGVLLDPENKELVNAFREAVEAGKKFHGTA